MPFAFGLGFFLRIFIPGMAAAFVVAAAIIGTSHNFRFVNGFPTLDQVSTFVLMSGLLGLAVRAFVPFANDFFYGVQWLAMPRAWCTSRLERRLRRGEDLIKRPSETLSEKELSQVRERIYVLCFPLDTSGRRQVVAPTLVGNLWASLLFYLYNLYGLQIPPALEMDIHMQFLFARLWWGLRPEIRRDVSDALAWSEALVGLLIAVYWGFLGFALAGFWQVYAAHGAWSAGFQLWAMAAILLLSTWFFYILLIRTTASAVVTLQATLGMLSDAEIERVVGSAQVLRGRSRGKHVGKNRPAQSTAPPETVSTSSHGEVDAVRSEWDKYVYRHPRRVPGIPSASGQPNPLDVKPLGNPKSEPS